MSINKAIVVGNLGRDPEVRALPSGQNVANFSVATNARFKDRNGEQQERTEWHRIVAFGKLADTCERFLSKGRQVYVEGRLTTRQYEAKDGSGKRYRTEIVALQMRLLGNRTNGTAAPKRKRPTISHSSSHQSGEPRKRLSLQPPTLQSEITKMDVYAIVTEKIINLLEQGVVPWRRPWTSAGLPRNLVSKKPYRGINHFLLSASKYVSPFWLTMRQANELGGHVRKGEESTIVVFWKVDDRSRARKTSTTRDRREDAPPVSSAILSRVQSRTMRTAASASSTSCRRSKRTSTIRSKRQSGSSPQCRTRLRFSTPDQRRFTARSLIASRCRRANLFTSAEEYGATLLTRLSTAPVIRSGLRAKALPKPRRLDPPSTPKRN